MNIYIIIYFILAIMALGIHLGLNGKPIQGKYSFLTKLTSISIGFWLLYMAGCFNHFIR